MISSWWVFWDTRALIFIAPLLKAFNIWSWILGIFGYAARYLNQNSRILKYCNTAVYPFYILHQTFTIIIGYFLMNLSWNPWLKAATMIAGTFFACILVYELLIRRAGWLRPLFGLKENKPAEPASGNTLANSRSSVRFSEPLD